MSLERRHQAGVQTAARTRAGVVDEELGREISEDQGDPQVAVGRISGAAPVQRQRTELCSAHVQRQGHRRRHPGGSGGRRVAGPPRKDRLGAGHHHGLAAAVGITGGPFATLELPLLDARDLGSGGRGQGRAAGFADQGHAGPGEPEVEGRRTAQPAQGGGCAGAPSVTWSSTRPSASRRASDPPWTLVPTCAVMLGSRPGTSADRAWGTASRWHPEQRNHTRRGPGRERHHENTTRGGRREADCAGQACWKARPGARPTRSAII